MKSNASSQRMTRALSSIKSHDLCFGRANRTASTTAMAESEFLRQLEESTGDARRLQLETLHSILEANAGTRYLRHLLAGYLPDAIDAAAFRRVVPLSSYDDYADLIARIADGVDPPTALSLDPLLCFFYRFSSIPSQEKKSILSP